MLTPNDYTNIQRMIDLTLTNALGWDKNTETNGEIASMDDLKLYVADFTNEDRR